VRPITIIDAGHLVSPTVPADPHREVKRFLAGFLQGMDCCPEGDGPGVPQDVADLDHTGTHDPPHHPIPDLIIVGAVSPEELGGAGGYHTLISDAFLPHQVTVLRVDSGTDTGGRALVTACDMLASGIHRTALVLGMDQHLLDADVDHEHMDGILRKQITFPLSNTHILDNYTKGFQRGFKGVSKGHYCWGSWILISTTRKNGPAVMIHASSTHATPDSHDPDIHSHVSFREEEDERGNGSLTSGVLGRMVDLIRPPLSNHNGRSVPGTEDEVELISRDRWAPAASHFVLKILRNNTAQDPYAAVSGPDHLDHSMKTGGSEPPAPEAIQPSGDDGDDIEGSSHIIQNSSDLQGSLCGDCDLMALPRRPRCHGCGGEMTPNNVRSTGHVLASTWVLFPPAGFSGPIEEALIEMDGGGRLLARALPAPPDVPGSAEYTIDDGKEGTVVGASRKGHDDPRGRNRMLEPPHEPVGRGTPVTIKRIDDHYIFTPENIGDV